MTQHKDQSEYSRRQWTPAKNAPSHHDYSEKSRDKPWKERNSENKPASHRYDERTSRHASRKHTRTGRQSSAFSDEDDRHSGSDMEDETVPFKYSRFAKNDPLPNIKVRDIPMETHKIPLETLLLRPSLARTATNWTARIASEITVPTVLSSSLSAFFQQVEAFVCNDATWKHTYTIDFSNEHRSFSQRTLGINPSHVEWLQSLPVLVEKVSTVSDANYSLEFRTGRKDNALRPLQQIYLRIGILVTLHRNGLKGKEREKVDELRMQLNNEDHQDNEYMMPTSDSTSGSNELLDLELTLSHLFVDVCRALTFVPFKMHHTFPFLPFPKIEQERNGDEYSTSLFLQADAFRNHTMKIAVVPFRIEDSDIFLPVDDVRSVPPPLSLLATDDTWHTTSNEMISCALQFTFSRSDEDFVGAIQKELTSLVENDLFYLFSQCRHASLSPYVAYDLTEPLTYKKSIGVFTPPARDDDSPAQPPLQVYLSSETNILDHQCAVLSIKRILAFNESIRETLTMSLAYLAEQKIGFNTVNEYISLQFSRYTLRSISPDTEMAYLTAEDWKEACYHLSFDRLVQKILRGDARQSRNPAVATQLWPLCAPLNLTWLCGKAFSRFLSRPPVFPMDSAEPSQAMSFPLFPQGDHLLQHIHRQALLLQSNEVLSLFELDRHMPASELAKVGREFGRTMNDMLLHATAHQVLGPHLSLFFHPELSPRQMQDKMAGQLSKSRSVVGDDGGLASVEDTRPIHYVHYISFFVKKLSPDLALLANADNEETQLPHFVPFKNARLIVHLVSEDGVASSLTIDVHEGQWSLMAPLNQKIVRMEWQGRYAKLYEPVIPCGHYLCDHVLPEVSKEQRVLLLTVFFASLTTFEAIVHHHETDEIFVGACWLWNKLNYLFKSLAKASQHDLTARYVYARVKGFLSKILVAATKNVSFGVWQHILQEKGELMAQVKTYVQPSTETTNPLDDQAALQTAGGLIRDAWEGLKNIRQTLVGRLQHPETARHFQSSLVYFGTMDFYLQGIEDTLHCIDASYRLEADLIQEKQQPGYEAPLRRRLFNVLIAPSVETPENYVNFLNNVKTDMYSDALPTIDVIKFKKKFYVFYLSSPLVKPYGAHVMRVEQGFPSMFYLIKLIMTLRLPYIVKTVHGVRLLQIIDRWPLWLRWLVFSMDDEDNSLVKSYLSYLKKQGTAALEHFEGLLRDMRDSQRCVRCLKRFEANQSVTAAPKGKPGVGSTAQISYECRCTSLVQTGSAFNSSALKEYLGKKHSYCVDCYEFMHEVHDHRMRKGARTFSRGTLPLNPCLLNILYTISGSEVRAAREYRKGPYLFYIDPVAEGWVVFSKYNSHHGG